MLKAGQSAAESSSMIRFSPSYWIAILATIIICTTTPQVAAQQHWQRCPEVVIVAARGSEQNDDITPTRYSATAPAEFGSNGYEAENLQGLLHLAEQRYAEHHLGASLMEKVAVLGLDAEAFPARMYLPPLGEEGKEVSAQQLASNLSGILSSAPVSDLVNRPINEAVTGINQGIDTLPAVLNTFEQSSGCHPDYVYLGFSQGTVVLGSQEHLLAQQGRLRGAVYIGDPTFDQSRLEEQDLLIGNPIVGRGIIPQIPPGTPEREALLRRHAPAAVPHLYYCLAEDYSCDFSAPAAIKAIHGQGGPHVEYFLHPQPTPADLRVADILITWLRQ